MNDSSFAKYSIDHIAHAVEALESTIQEYEKNFGVRPFYRESRPDHGVEIVFFDFGSTKIELIAPLKEGSRLSSFLDSRGPGLHHICYRVENIRAELRRLEALGHRLIDHTPREGALGTEIAFIHPSSMRGVLVELCEYHEKDS